MHEQGEQDYFDEFFKLKKDTDQIYIFMELWRYFNKSSEKYFSKDVSVVFFMY